MTQNRNEEYALLIDCGDGVPILNLDGAPTTVTAEKHPVEQPTTRTMATTHPAPKDEEKLLPVRTAAILATIVGQVAIGLGVVLGANPLIAGFAALAMMATGVGLALADVLTKQY